MRARIAVWMVGAIAASAAVSAVALGQTSTWGSSAAGGPPDAGGSTPPSATWGHAPDVADAGPVAPTGFRSTWGAGSTPSPFDGGLETAPDAAAAERTAPSPPSAPARPPPEQDAGAADDGGGGGFEPSDTGFAVGLRGGYGVPFGTANGSSLSSVTLGMVPITADVGWFFSPHFYLGGYFAYAFGIGADQANDACNGTDVSCTATMIRFGLVAHYHFAPAATWDPWIGGGLGYEIINLQSTDQTDNSNPLSSALQGIDVTAEAGLDFKPLHYLGIGPYVELATGPYFGTDSFGMHGWVTFGARFRTNL